MVWPDFQIIEFICGVLILKLRRSGFENFLSLMWGREKVIFWGGIHDADRSRKQLFHVTTSRQFSKIRFSKFDLKNRTVGLLKKELVIIGPWNKTVNDCWPALLLPVAGNARALFQGGNFFYFWKKNFDFIGVPCGAINQLLVVYYAIQRDHTVCHALGGQLDDLIILVATLGCVRNWTEHIGFTNTY